MYDFNQFNLSDMISCSRQLRELGHSSVSMEEAAQRTVRFFFEQFVDTATGERSCALVRIFKTHNFFDLSEQLQSCVPRDTNKSLWPENMKAMVLLATAGENEEWNHRTSSKNHQVIPLPSPELVEHMPMISQLVKQFGFDLPAIVRPQTSLLLEPEEQLHGLFFVPDAVGSPYIPDQSHFITTYGIKSVIGFGAMLPSGNLFAAIIFSKKYISEKTEQLFKPLALAIKSAMVPFDGSRIFDITKNQRLPNEADLATIVRLKSELAAIRELLNVSDETVENQANKLEETSRQLAQARDAALEASALKSAFVANISHELRTPLSTIVGMSQLLINSNLTDDQIELGLGIDESSRNLLSIVNDLLDFSKIEAGKFAIETVPFSPNELIQEVAKSMADRARAKQLSLLTNFDQLLPQHLLGDRSRIRQVLLNLVTNAIKFTDKGQVVITAAAINQEAQPIMVRFSVKDTGIGLSDDDSARLFVAFSQLESASKRQAGGTGLGLSISKKLVELMDGEIGVESELGSGSEFWFTLPLQTPVKDLELPNRVQFQKSKWQSKIPEDSRILVVEDNKLIRNLVVKQLFNLGVEATGVATGLEAVSIASNTRFDLILMDCNLPDISGFEVTRLIREYERRSGHNTAIVAVTALAMPGDKERCFESGMDDYLSKPVVMEQLIEKLEYWLVTNKERKRLQNDKRGDSSAT